MSYFDENGNEVDGLLTQEELDAKLAEERTALQAKLDEQKAQADERVNNLEVERKLALQKLESYEAQAGSAGDGGGDKDVNLANLRKKLEDTTAALEEERQLNAQRFTGILNERIEQEIRTIAGNDVELAKKIRFNYDNVLTGMKASTQEEIRTKALNAARLSAPASSDGPDPLSMAISGGNRGYSAPASAGTAKKFTPNEVKAGSMFGVSDQDRAKYANDPRLKH
jgi:hypothetical protein